MHIEQWLIAHDGSLKLNDLQYSKALEWEDDAQDFCMIDGIAAVKLDQNPDC